MKVFVSLAIAAVLGLVYPRVVAAQWSSAVPNPLVDNNGQNFNNVGYNQLSGVIDHVPGVNVISGFAVLFTPSFLPAGLNYALAWSMNGSQYTRLDNSDMGMLHPYTVRLSTSLAGSRLYLFYSDPANASELMVRSSSSSITSAGFIPLNSYGIPAVKVYTGNTITSVSASVLNDVVYIAIQTDSGNVVIVSSSDMQTFSVEGLAVDLSGYNLLTVGNITLLTAEAPSTLPEGQTLYLYYGCGGDTGSSCPMGYANFAPFVQFLGGVAAFDTDNGLRTATQLASITGTAAAVSYNGQAALLVRAGQSVIGGPNLVWWMVVQTVSSTSTTEIALTDGGAGNTAAVSKVTPAVIYDRVAGSSSAYGNVTIVWANAADNTLYAVSGNPF